MIRARLATQQLYARENAGVFATKFLTKSMISVVFCVGSAVWAQAQDAQQNSTGETETTTTQTSRDNTNPSRTTESHSKSGNQTVDARRVEVLGNDGRYRPDYDTETETVRVDDTTTRTVVRTYTSECKWTKETSGSNRSGNTNHSKWRWSDGTHNLEFRCEWEASSRTA
jgi:hypothetical protein